MMKHRLGHEEAANYPQNIHDYVIYCAHEEKLMEQYEQNKEPVKSHVEDLLQSSCSLSGQQSIDIMQTEAEFWLIFSKR